MSLGEFHRFKIFTENQTKVKGGVKGESSVDDSLASVNCMIKRSPGGQGKLFWRLYSLLGVLGKSHSYFLEIDYSVEGADAHKEKKRLLGKSVRITIPPNKYKK